MTTRNQLTDQMYLDVTRTTLGKKAGQYLYTSTSIGTNSVLVGVNAGSSMTSGSANNTMVGYSAGQTVNTGTDNVFIGCNSGNNRTIDVGCVGIGSGVLTTTGTVTSGASNLTAVGYKALASNTTGYSNTAIGYNSGNVVTSGYNNTLLGSNSGVAITTGNDNIVIGNNVAPNLSTGQGNVMIGTVGTGNVMNNNWTVAIGASAGTNLTTGASGAVVIGRAAGYIMTTVPITAVGYQAGYLSNVTAGGRSTFLGYTAGFNNRGDDMVIIGDSAAGNTSVGAPGIQMGRGVVIGSRACYDIGEDTPGRSCGTDMVVIGFEAGRYLDDAGASIGMTLIGSYAGWSMGIVYGNTAIGYMSSYSCATGTHNTSVGYQSHYSNTGGNNTSIGYMAGYTGTSGNNNTLLGCQAGYSATSASNNTMIGQNAGYYSTGSGNTIIGSSAGPTSTSSASNVTCVGYNSSASPPSGNSTAIGYNSNVTGDNMCVIGNAQRLVETGTGHLGIMQTNTLPDSNSTITAAMLLSGIVIMNPTAERTYTLETPANMLTNVWYATVNTPGCLNGNCLFVMFVNASSFTCTIAAPSSVHIQYLSGQSILANTARWLVIRLNSYSSGDYFIFG